jgi:hypothetical protein
VLQESRAVTRVPSYCIGNAAVIGKQSARSPARGRTRGRPFARANASSDHVQCGGLGRPPGLAVGADRLALVSGQRPNVAQIVQRAVDAIPDLDVLLADDLEHQVAIEAKQVLNRAEGVSPRRELRTSGFRLCCGAGASALNVAWRQAVT